jgi:hypothetical protein
MACEFQPGERETRAAGTVFALAQRDFAHSQCLELAETRFCLGDRVAQP